MDEIITENSNEILKKYLNKTALSEEEAIIYNKQKENERKMQDRIELQKKDPVCKELYQIATDLRFIKNYIIFSIIANIVLGIMIAIILL